MTPPAPSIKVDYSTLRLRSSLARFVYPTGRQTNQLIGMGRISSGPGIVKKVVFMRCYQNKLDGKADAYYQSGHGPVELMVLSQIAYSLFVGTKEDN